mmetsp:Transcript_19918/g.66340  ORF Transcript_19918/g.66340 Transcript_19918/m.66340 type:complete len:135 (-) Transcript_19918:2122-2526(-)
MDLTTKDILILMKEIMEGMMMVKEEMMMLTMMKEMMEVMKKKKKMMKMKLEMMMMMQVIMVISWWCFRGSAPTFALRRCSVWTDGFVESVHVLGIIHSLGRHLSRGVSNDLDHYILRRTMQSLIQQEASHIFVA